jgi:pimeloyl-ACP methyl ester carboxylesterase
VGHLANRSAQVTPSRVVVAAVVIALLGVACAPPVRVRYADPKTVHRQLTRSILTGQDVSGPTHNVLHRFDLLKSFQKHPEQVLAALHAQVTDDAADPDIVFALAELSFSYAERAKDPKPHYLAAAVYSWAFLFPARRDLTPHRFDPRVRLASDFYNVGLTNGFAEGERGRHVLIAGGVYRLPFGELHVAFDESQLRWGERKMVRFAPAAEIQVVGLQERYRRTGLGAPLAATTEPLAEEPYEFVAPNTRVPVTALLRIPAARRQIAAGRVEATLDLYDAQVTETVRVGERDVPLEVEPTAALAYALTESRPWEMELRGFFGSGILAEVPTKLRATQPYIRGRIPVVFVHGTASSVTRWADMVNDLSNTPAIRDHFTFWFFTYDTGNPILYTAASLRQLLTDAVMRLDPQGTDPALHDMVVIGHSQGGLLTKLTAVDSGDKFYRWKTPFEQLKMKDETRELFRSMLFLKPLPFVKRVIFVATPHRGSYLTGNFLAHYVSRFIKLPRRALDSVAEIVKGNPEFATFRAPTAVDNMTPTNPFVQELAAMSVDDGIAANSIVAVQGEGPPEDLDDGVVEYTSAHRTDVESEVVVRSGHSCQSNPKTVAEVQRILLHHLAEFEQTSGHAHAPQPAL